ncbi:MAG: J domain-containing protein [Caulobacterales bacterium]
MARDFAYRPKFVDIRIKPPADEASARAKPKAKAKVEAPEEKTCDAEGCKRAATSRAPRSRTNLNEYYWFCVSHAADYNRSWNFFQGMDDQEYQSFAESARTGHRPTWSMQADNMSRESAAARGVNIDPAKVQDPYGILPRRPGARPARPEPERRLNRVQMTALEELALDEEADSRAIRLRYAELIKRFHPDSNGGDRSAEEKLNRVIKAYQVLKTAGLA